MPLDLQNLTSSPEYKELMAKRRRLILPLVVLTVGAYVAFILAIAFIPAKLGVMVGSVSLGILLGLALILFNIIVTLIYVRAANRNIEPVIRRLHHMAGDAR